MELHHFRYFVAVAEDLNFTKAAKRLGMAQPPLSRQIHALENEIGVQLFERRSGRVFLTDAGRRFLDAARNVLQEAGAAVAIARHGKDGALGIVRVGFGKGLGDVVSTVMNHHIRLYPNVEVDVRDIFSGFQIEALRTRKVDVAFSHGHTASLDLLSEKLFREGLTLVVPRSSRLANRSTLRMQNLKGQNLLVIDRALSPVVHDKILELYRNARIDLNLVHTETTCYDEAGALTIASGRGVAIAVGGSPAHPSFGNRLVAVPLREPLGWVDVCIVWRKGESAPTVLNFIDSARELLQGTRRIADLRSFPRAPRPRRQKKH
jgi:DNA-binding transcriptional LysR family regulator